MSTKENSAAPANNMNTPNVKSYGRVVMTLGNCLLPEEKLNSPPSYLDGLDAEIETDLRILGCELIQTAGILLKLPQVAMATGQVLFQRYYYSKSFIRCKMETTAMGCICLASKIEEAPTRIRNIINVFNHIKQVSSQKPIRPVVLDQNYVALKNEVIKSERRVLKELGFCVHVKHPHKIIVMYLQPETVACACIYLAARQLQLPLPTSPPWFSLFRVSESAIRDVCRRILGLYSRPRVSPEQLEKRVEELRRQYEEARAKAREERRAVNGHAPSPPSPSSPLPSQPLPKHYNAWGGFISRTGTHAAPERTKSPRRSESPGTSSLRSEGAKHSKRKERSRSRSRSHSHGRPGKIRKAEQGRSGSHKSSRSRYRSRSHSRGRSGEIRKAEQGRSGSHKSSRSRYRSRSHSRGRPGEISKAGQGRSGSHKSSRSRYRSRDRSRDRDLEKSNKHRRH